VVLYVNNQNLRPACNPCEQRVKADIHFLLYTA
jgi:hypothetical protein